MTALPPPLIQTQQPSQTSPSKSTTHPFYIVGPYRYGVFSIPRMNLLRYGITMLICTALLPFLYKFQAYFKFPTYTLYLAYFIYTLALFYFFGVVSIGYIIYANFRSLSADFTTHEFTKN